MSRLKLTYWQRRRLREQLKTTSDARTYRRTLAVLELDRGRPAAEVAAMLGVTRQSVHNWAAAFVRDPDPAVLRDADRSGRPPLLAEPTEGLLPSLLGQSPQGLGFRTRIGRYPCSSRSWRRAWGSGLRTRRCGGRCDDSATSGSGPATSSTPTRSARKKRRIRWRIRNLPRRSVVLAQDETDLMMFPPLRAGWSLRGEPAKVHLSGRNARRVIFGAMNLLTGTRLLLPQPKGRAANFQAFLGHVRQHYRSWHVALLLDEDPSHTAKGSLRAAEGMTLLWLPKRSPELNPMDTLWGQAKDVIAANKQYATIDELVDRFLAHLDSLSGREALHTSGVLSENFWLRATLSKMFCGPA